MYNIAPSTLPCRTPDVIGYSSDIYSFTFTVNRLLAGEWRPLTPHTHSRGRFEPHPESPVILVKLTYCLLSVPFLLVPARH